MNLVICHYSFSLKASLHSKEKAHVRGKEGGGRRNEKYFTSKIARDKKLIVIE